MDLIQIIYASSHNQMPPNAIRAMLQQASTANQNNQISGFVCADNYYFLQAIEGDAYQVDKLFAAICNDTRHFNISLIKRRAIPQRDFAHWGMGAVLQLETHKHLLESVLPEPEFNPYQLDSLQSIALLKGFMNLKTLR
ncbi:BLUF domain-containing protein [Shewanella sp. SNU WT4]|uniref:BLUF domain-containing protein n=1 Tax=Shewanella sp. SNU WT4 TaxID=2590015 RepID=UPI001126954D|nr:BLUF domain-containing protein [Shewanella sp. SNU WT4]QDF65601.1 BLUF domain-containing protein [Shewanella sp. SNU WT4]